MKIFFSAILLAVLAFPFSLSSQTFTNSTPVNFTTVSSASPACMSVIVSGIPDVLNNDLGLVSVTLDITHPNVKNIDVNLVTPAGNTIQIIEGFYIAGTNLTNTVLTQNSGTQIANGASPYTGSYRAKTFGSFDFCQINNNSEIGNGNWKVCVYYNSGSAAGSINSVTLTFGEKGGSIYGDNTATNSIIDANLPTICSFDDYYGNTSKCYSVSDTAGTTLDAVTPFVLNNNSWISFVAAATTVNLGVQVSNCFSTSTPGIQMVVLSTNDNVSFTKVGSNLPNPMPPGLNNISLSGLTPGNTYYLMADGYAGDVCFYEVITSSNSGILVGDAVTSKDTICVGDSAQLTGSGGSSYSWAPSTGLSNPNSENPIAKPTTTTTYVVTITTATGCIATDTVTIHVIPVPLANAGLDEVICKNASVQLNASGGNVFSWSPAIGLSDANVNNPVANPSSTTNYIVAVGNGHCTVNDTVNVSVNIPIINAGSDETICPTNSVQLNAGGGVSYSWSPTTGLSASNIANPVASPATTTTYVVTGNDGTCSNKDTLTVNVSSLDNASFNYNPASVCQTATSNPVANTTGGSSGNFTSSPAGLTFANTSTGEIDVANSAVGNYTLTFTTNNPGGCPNTSTASFSIYAPPGDASFSFNPSYCTGDINDFPVMTGTIGTFSASPAGLAINVSTGELDFSSSSSGTYTVYNNIGSTAGCATVIDSNYVIVNATPDAAFSGLNLSYCETGGAVTLIPVTAGGVFSGTGVSGNSFNPSLAGAGTQTISYSISANGCNAASSQTVNVDNYLAALISSSGSNSCEGQTVSLTSSSATGNSWNTGATIQSIDVASNGTYTLTVTNGSCSSSANEIVTFLPVSNPAFNYAQSLYCQSFGFNPLADITGDAAGIFSATPAGLVFQNTSTGLIDIDASTPAIYTVKFVTNVNSECPDSTTFSLEVRSNSGDATFSFNASYCTNESDPSPSMTGTKGTFSATPAGLSINASTGIIDLSASAAGSYNVTNDLGANGGCAAIMHTTSVIVKASPNASYSGLNSPYCETETPVSLTPVFAGGSFNGNGVIGNTFDPSIAGPGTHAIKYVVSSNGCPDSTIQNVVVDSDVLAVIASSGSTSCTSPVTLISSVSSGNSWSDGSVNQSTDVTTSGTYTLTVSNGSCINSISELVTINTLDDASFSYSSSSYCTGAAVTPSANITGGSTGTFSATPAGLVFLDNSTGQIDVDASLAGNYNITFTTNGICPSSSTVSLSVIVPPGDATFSFNPSYCLNDINPLPVMGAGASKGVFTSSPAGLSINQFTGEIDLAGSLPGIYDIVNDLGAFGGCSPVTFIVSVEIYSIPDATFSGLNAVYCETDPAIVLTPSIAGGIFSGTGIVGNTFDPNIAGQGIHNITYTISSGSCSDVTTQTVAVDNFVAAIITSSGSDTCIGQMVTLTSLSPTGNSWNTSETSQSINVTASGIYTLTVTNGTCVSTASEQVIFKPVSDPSFTYPQSLYCKGFGEVAVANLGGGSTGLFSSSPVGLVFSDNATGEIDIDASASGNYVIKFVTNVTGECVDSAIFSLQINDKPADATFSYTGAYCINDADPLANLAPGASYGAFSSTPVGLTVNPSTGEIDLGNSVPGTYTVANDLGPVAGCPQIAYSTSIQVLSAPDASFNYSSSSYCNNSGLTPIPTITGGATGTFAATPAGLSFVDTRTGQIDVNASLDGTYTITFTTDVIAGCNNSSDFILSIITPPGDASFGFNALYCINDAKALPAMGIGASKGIFAATPAGLSINQFTGEINPALSTPGAYNITNDLGVFGGCAPISYSTTVVIYDKPDASFSGLNSVYCEASSSVSLSPASGVYLGSGISGNIFDPSASGQGSFVIKHVETDANGCKDTASQNVVVDANLAASITSSGSIVCPGETVTLTSSSPVGNFWSTGETTQAITVSTSQDVSLTVINGSCTNNTTESVIILTLDDPSFKYNSASYCKQSGQTQTADIFGGSSGIFTSSPAGLAILDNTTGEIDVDASDAGIYVITFTTNTPGGCTNASIFNLTIIDPPGDPSFTYNASYCNTETNPLPIMASGAVIGSFSATPAGMVINPFTGLIDLVSSAPGTYTVSNSLSASGCGPAIVSQTVTLIETPDANFDYGSTQFCNSSGINPVPTKDVSVSGTFTASPAGLVLISNSTGEINLSGSTPGTYVITYYATAGGLCPSSYNQTISIVDDNGNATFAYNTNTYCTGDGLQSPVMTGTKGTFTATPSGLTIDAITGDITPGTSIVGTYTITNTLPVVGNCTSKSDQFTITINQTPVASFTGINGPYCEDNAPLALMPATSGGTFSGNGISGNTFDPALSGSGTHIIQYNLSVNGCVAASSQAVVIDALPVVNITSSTSFPLCDGDSVILTSSSASNNSWSTGETGTGIVVKTSGSFTVTLTNGTCQATSAPFDVVINPLPLVNISTNDTIVCKGESVTLTSSASNDYTWSTGEKTGSITVWPVLDMTSYFVNVSDGNCQNSDTINIYVSAPIADFEVSPDSGMAALEINLMDNSTDAISWEWTFGDATPNETGTSAQHIYLNSGVYEIKLIVNDINNCIDSAQKQIIVTAEPSLWIPNAFTPNNDGINEIYNIASQGMESYKVMIFNRWGEMVIEWDNLNETGWDGTTKSGLMAPEGTYVYVVKSIGIDKIKYEKSGHLTLLR